MQDDIYDRITANIDKRLSVTETKLEELKSVIGERLAKIDKDIANIDSEARGIVILKEKVRYIEEKIANGGSNASGLSFKNPKDWLVMISLAVGLSSGVIGGTAAANVNDGPTAEFYNEIKELIIDHRKDASKNEL